MIWLILSLIFLGIEYLILKNISINKGTFREEFVRFPFKVWHLILLIIGNIIPVVNIIVFAVFMIYLLVMWMESDIKMNYNSDSEFFKFLNRKL